MDSLKTTPGTTAAKKQKLEEQERSSLSAPTGGGGLLAEQQDKLALLPQMVRLLSAMQVQDHQALSPLEACPKDEQDTCRQKQIDEARAQVENIERMKKELDAYSNMVYKQLLEKSESRIRGLLDSSSPLLCLGELIVKHVISYLDEAALLSLSVASSTVHRYFRATALTELNDRRKLRGIITSGFFPIPLSANKKKMTPAERRELAKISLETVPFERAQSFVKASCFAKKVETEAAHHYNYDQEETVKLDSLPLLPEYEDMQVCCNECDFLKEMPPLSRVLRSIRPEGPWECAVFVRLSYRDGGEGSPKKHEDKRSSNSNPLIWEGFVRPRYVAESCTCRWDDDDYYDWDPCVCETFQGVFFDISIENIIAAWPELKDHLIWLDQTSLAQKQEEPRQPLLAHEKEKRRKSLVENIQVTAVLFDSPTSPVWHHLLHHPKRWKGVCPIIATGGYSKCEEDGRVYLQPRNDRYHDKTWNPKRFIETSLKVGERCICFFIKDLNYG